MVSEKEFSQQVVDLARMLGYKVYRTWRSIHSPAGYPDLCLLKPPRLIYAELKTDKRSSKLSQEQARWLWELRKVAECYVWRPRQFDKIVGVLNNA